MFNQYLIFFNSRIKWRKICLINIMFYIDLSKNFKCFFMKGTGKKKYFYKLIQVVYYYYFVILIEIN